MSAYGDFKVPSSGRILPTMNWATKNPSTYIMTIHLTLSTARQSPGLVEYLNVVFLKVVEDGRTYPQEGDMSGEAFEKYFFAADVFLGIVSSSHSEETQKNGEGTLEDIRAGRSWEDCVAGFYYVRAYFLTIVLLPDTVKPDKTKLSRAFISCRSINDRFADSADQLARSVMPGLWYPTFTVGQDLVLYWQSHTCITPRDSDTRQAYSILFTSITSLPSSESMIEIFLIPICAHHREFFLQDMGKSWLRKGR